jgi:processive 1,2-diacylglycerol beta-glucosyltransferase
MSKRILIVTEEWAGSGHRMAAVALREAVEAHSPGAEVRIIGGLDQTSPSLREISRLFYVNSLRYCPGLWQRLYERDQLWSGMLKKPLGKWLSTRLIQNVLEQEKPDVVVATHAYCLTALAEAKQMVRHPYHLIGIPTDYYVNRFWVHPGTDGYVVGHERVAEQLEKHHGVKRDKVAAYGIPVRRRFGEAMTSSKAEWKQRLGLRPDLFTVLLGGGEGGYGRMDWVLQSLIAVEAPLQIVVVTGRNEKMKRRLQSFLDGQVHPHVVLIKGYETAMWEWMGAADIYVTKPGGISCAEALAVQTPLLLYQPLPGQELWNAQFLLEQQVAKLASSPEEVADLICQWQKQGTAWSDVIARMAEIGRPHSADQAAEYLLQL